MDTNAVAARQLFYEGTKAYKTGDFPVAAEKFKEGLRVWKAVMDDFPTYRDDELSARRKPVRSSSVTCRVLTAEPHADSRRSAVQGLLEAG